MKRPPPDARAYASRRSSLRSKKQPAAMLENVRMIARSDGRDAEKNERASARFHAGN
jgi:hypothetical protein